MKRSPVVMGTSEVKWFVKNRVSINVSLLCMERWLGMQLMELEQIWLHVNFSCTLVRICMCVLIAEKDYKSFCSYSGTDVHVTMISAPCICCGAFCCKQALGFPARISHSAVLGWLNQGHVIKSPLFLLSVLSYSAWLLLTSGILFCSHKMTIGISETCMVM